MAILSSDHKSVKVQKNDTLSQICQTYDKYIDPSLKRSTYDQTAEALAKYNNISNRHLIYPGQTIKLSGGAVSPTSNPVTSNKPEIIGGIRLQADKDRTVFAKWKWDRTAHMQGFRTIWRWRASDGEWFIGPDSGNGSTSWLYESVYDAPDNAVEVRFNVRPIYTKRKLSNGKEEPWDEANWSDNAYYSFTNNPPVKPSSAPTLEIDTKTSTLTITAKDLVDLNATHIEFEIYKNDSSRYGSLQKVKITPTAIATLQVTVTDGNTYKVRCRSVDGDEVSDWTAFSDSVSTKPSAPSKITVCKALTESSVLLEWSEVKTAETYDIQYAITDDNRNYFETPSDDWPKETTDIEQNSYELTGLDSGHRYAFRVRAINKEGDESVWTSVKYVSIGSKPSAPTTWSSTTTASMANLNPSVSTTESLKLYWVHNAEDESSQVAAELDLIINGTTITGSNGLLLNNTTDKDKRDETSYVALSYKNSYFIVTDRFGNEKLKTSIASFGEGAEIKWRVRTRGATEEFGDYSVQRTITVYAEPTIAMQICDKNGIPVEKISSFPFYIHCEAGPSTQIPLGYSISIVSNETYETIDNAGNDTVILEGQTIYSKYYDNPNEVLVRNANGKLEYVQNTSGTPSEFLLELSAGSINLENSMSYTVNCMVAMNSGLTASASSEFEVAWISIPHLHFVSNVDGDANNRIYYKTPDPGDINLTHPFSHNQGDIYKLTFSAKSDIRGSTLTSCVAGNKEYNFETYELSSHWEDFELIYEAAASGSLTFWLEDGNMSVDITDIKLVRASSDDGNGNYTWEADSQLADDAGINTKRWTLLGDVMLTAVDIGYLPNAVITIDYDNVSAMIRPFCEDGENNTIEGVTLSVYRKNYDGTFTEIARNIANSKGSYVVDPHPSLDYVRYRITATTSATGITRYYDTPAQKVDYVGAIIQWDETWSPFRVADGSDDGENYDVADVSRWGGSMLRLPYNIDISEQYNPEVSLVSYIGREHQVSYYGTQKGVGASWNTDIPKADKATLYGLRRLANWMGDVYVREPSGTGHWANVKVTFPIKHLEVTIPVTIQITRVEGGV